MKILGFLLLISMAVSITIELNNIHNGYRNVYKGTVQIEEPKISLKPFVLIKLSRNLLKMSLKRKIQGRFLYWEMKFRLIWINM